MSVFTVDDGSPRLIGSQCAGCGVVIPAPGGGMTYAVQAAEEDTVPQETTAEDTDER